MALTTPSPVAPPDEPPDPEALIEEARRHQRRRRRRDAILAALGFVAVVGTVIGFGGTGAGHGGTAPHRPSDPSRPVVQAPVSAHNGTLTVMAVRANRQAEGPAGYYGISQIGRGGNAHVFAP